MLSYNVQCGRRTVSRRRHGRGRRGWALAGSAAARPEPMLAAWQEVGPEQAWQDRGLGVLGRLDPQESLDRARFFTDREHAGPSF